MALTETCLRSTIDTTCIGELVPSCYVMKRIPRRGRKGDGVALIYKSVILLRLITSSYDGNFTHFEHMDCNLEVGHLSIRLAVVYRPPPSANNELKTTVFLENEWPAFLAKYATIPKDIVIVGCCG